MVPELGHFALIIGLLTAMALMVLPLLGVYWRQPVLAASCRSLAAGLFVFTLLAFAILAWAFLHDDFSVKYVAGNSNTLLPDRYKFSAVWGGHEGSLLLWALVLSGWTFAVSIFSRNLPMDMLARVLSVMGAIAVGFFLFMLLTSNPFERILPNAPTEGGDLNPLLQDFGLIIHPPMLYMGYVGFSVAFAFSIAALMSGRLDSAWAKWSRPWTNTAWAFLSVGIALGSWWAYYELGWGGWWFWDPVENASFMPWLVGTALIHSLAVTEKRGIFKSWTILLAIMAFSLSLLGTFLVRSGVLTSVHAFANDPERGVFILGFLLVVIGGSLLLYGFRAPQVKSIATFSWLSREALLLGNNILLVVAMATVLLGTLYPLVADALGLGRISVGPPYFNFFIAPLMFILAVLLGIGLHANWKKTNPGKVWGILRWPVVTAVVVGMVAPFAYEKYKIGAALAVMLGSWIIFSAVADIRNKTRNAVSLWQGLRKLSRSYAGMQLAHTGMAFAIIGAVIATVYSDQRDVRLAPGESLTLGGYEYRFEGVSRIQQENYTADRGLLTIHADGKLVAKLEPEKRRYASGGNMMTEAAIDAGFFKDIYVALGEPLEKGAWAVRLHYKPLVRWIWLGALLMAAGGLLAVLDKRYRLTAKVQKPLLNAGAARTATRS